LYLKGLQNTGSIYFEKQLSRASILAPDRKKLYELCFQSTLQNIISTVENTSENEALKASLLDYSTIELLKEVDPENKIINELPINKVEPSEIIKKDALLQSLEEDILLEAINHSIQIDVDDELKSIAVEQQIEADLISEENTLENEQKVSKPISSSPKKLSDWLSVMQPIEANLTIYITNVSSTKKKLASQQSLIDQFLKLEDKTIKVKKDPVTPQQMAKMSLVENEDFVTETLAKIYASQGNFLKSIKIYEQLMLTIPEKKVFFASRIRFLKEKMEYEH
jgi:tetratricopeptide (TPR) repeat protein